MVNRGKTWFVIVLMIIGLVLLIISPVLGKIMQMALSRRREFLADSTAAEITRNPQGLISALQKLDSDPNELKKCAYWYQIYFNNNTNN